MTRRFVQYGLFLMVLLFAAGTAWADAKLGFVNAPRLLEESPQAQAAAQKMKDEFSDRDKKLSKSKAELDAMQKRLNTDGDIMSETKRKQMRLDILSRQRDVMRDEEALRQDLAIRRSDVIGGLQDVIRSAIEAIGKRGKYDIIFYDGISYGNPALDITEQVLTELKKPKYQKSAAKDSKK